MPLTESQRQTLAQIVATGPDQVSLNLNSKSVKWLDENGYIKVVGEVPRVGTRWAITPKAQEEFTPAGRLTTMFYAVSKDGSKVFSFKAMSAAMERATELEGFTASDKELTNLPMPLLVTLYNRVRPERPVTKFADRESAEKRMVGVLETLAKPGVPATETSTDGTVTKTTKKEKTPKEPAAPKEPSITKASPIYAQIVELRKQNVAWEAIRLQLKVGRSVTGRVRALMKENVPTMVRASYDRAASKASAPERAAAAALKKAEAKAKKEAAAQEREAKKQAKKEAAQKAKDEAAAATAAPAATPEGSNVVTGPKADAALKKAEAKEAAKATAKK